MPNPLNVHVNQPLTDLSIGHFETEIEKYVSPRAFPMVGLRKQSDLVYEYNRGDLARLEMAMRASGAVADRGGWRLSTTAITTQRWALGQAIGNDEIHNQDEVLDLENDAMQYLMEQWLLRMDERFAAAAFAAGLWTTDLTAGVGFTAWDAAAATPSTDIHEAKNTIRRLAMARLPDEDFVLICGVNAWSALKEAADIENKFAQTQTGILTRKLVAQACEIGDVIVADTIQNTGPEGGADTGAFVFNARHALLVHRQPNPGKRKLSGGYTYCWTGRPGNSKYGHNLKSWDDVDTDARLVELNAYFVHQRMSDDLGAFFINAGPA